MTMAVNPFGFEPFKSEGKENRVREYTKTSGHAAYPGDALTLIAAGTVSVAAAGEVLIGVAAEYAASATTTIKVYDDPDMEFIVQASGPLAAADIGLNMNIVANSADTTLKQSNHTVDYTSLANTATLQFKLMGLVDRIADNTTWGSYNVVRVKPQSHFLGSKPAGI